MSGRDLETPSIGRARRLESALDFASDALVTLNAAGIVEHLNRAAERLLGVDRSTHVERGVAELFAEPSDGQNDAVHAIARAVVQGTDVEGRIAPRRFPGLLRYEVRASVNGAGAKGATLRLSSDRPNELQGADAILNPIVYDSRADERTASLETDDRFLGQLDELLRSSIDPAEVLVGVASRVGAHLGVARCLFYDVSISRNEAVAHPGYEETPITAIGPHRLDALGEETCSWMLSGRIVATTDTQTDPRTRDRYESAYAPYGVRASLLVPLMRGSECVGFVSVTSTTPRSWTAREISLVQAVATKTWLFIEHGRAVRNQESLVEELRAFNAELERRVQARTSELSRALSERVASESALRQDEARYRRLFHESPTALCEQDFSLVRAYFDELVEGGVTDLAGHLRGHPEAVAGAARRVRFIEVNEATLEMFEADSREEIFANWHKLFGREMLQVFLEQLCFLVEGSDSTFAARCATRTLKGRRNEIAFRLSVLPGSERNWSRLLASIFDTTAYLEAERKLKEALREKEVLLKEVHHRVKNNLQVISSLLSLQAQYVESASVRAVFATSQARVQSIALVHEKLYQSKDLSHIRFDEYLEKLIADLWSAQSAGERGIAAVVEVADLSLSVNIAIPCGLIVNELVSNALKHAFDVASSGTITVRARHARENVIELSVADDGRGLPPTLDPRKSPSLGLDLVFTFAEQLGAEVEILRHPGTAFVFRFREEAA
jgi:two-component sensor histidine kinase/PAS domain-containing protein